ncbi:MAG: hypothetical protein L0Y57_11970, partial [Beijerinckiaceae bacterium]|nr:hypothetical protein [Beijerinckiaceae bacterium]
RAAAFQAEYEGSITFTRSTSFRAVPIKAGVAPLLASQSLLRRMIPGSLWLDKRESLTPAAGCPAWL